MKIALKPHSYPRWLSICLALILVALVHFIFQWPSYYKINCDINSAHKALKSGDYSKAIELYSLVLSKAPLCKKAQNGLNKANKIKENQSLTQVGS